MNLLFVHMMNKKPIVNSYRYLIYFCDDSGLYHCKYDNLPAFLCYEKGREYYLYYNHGKFHNLNGPACVFMSEKLEDEFWIDDTHYSKESWEIRVREIQRNM